MKGISRLSVLCVFLAINFRISLQSAEVCWLGFFVPTLFLSKCFVSFLQIIGWDENSDRNMTHYVNKDMGVLISPEDKSKRPNKEENNK